MTSGTKSTDPRISAPRARRGERRSKNVATATRMNTMPMAVTTSVGSTVIFTGSGGGSKETPLSAGSRFGAT